MRKSIREINSYLRSAGWNGSLLIPFIDYYEQNRWNGASNDEEAYRDFKISRGQAYKIEKGNFQRSHCCINKDKV